MSSSQLTVWPDYPKMQSFYAIKTSPTACALCAEPTDVHVHVAKCGMMYFDLESPAMRFPNSPKM